MRKPAKHHRLGQQHLWGALLAGVAMLVICVIALAARSGTQSSDPARSPIGAARGTVKAYVDPATGQLSQNPPPGTFSSERSVSSSDVDDSLRTSSLGLFEVELPSGAIKVDLQGRFQSALVATVTDGGGYTIDCENSTAATGVGE